MPLEPGLRGTELPCPIEIPDGEGEHECDEGQHQPAVLLRRLSEEVLHRHTRADDADERPLEQPCAEEGK